MFSSSGWVLLIPAVMGLNKAVIYSTCFAWTNTAYSKRCLDGS